MMTVTMIAPAVFLACAAVMAGFLFRVWNTEHRPIAWIMVGNVTLLTDLTIERSWVVAFRLSTQGVIDPTLWQRMLESSPLTVARPLSLIAGSLLITGITVMIATGAHASKTRRWGICCLGLTLFCYGIMLAFLFR